MRSHREPFYFFFLLRRRVTGRSQINDRDKETYEKDGDPCDLCLSPLIQWLHTPLPTPKFSQVPPPFLLRVEKYKDDESERMYSIQ